MPEPSSFRKLRRSILHTLLSELLFSLRTRCNSAHGHMPKIACFDIELSPNLAWVWGAYEQNAIGDFEKEFELLSFAYQWLGQKKIHVKARCDYKDDSDKALTEDLWALFHEADILIGHNVDRFDVRKANQRFLFHQLTPPSHFRTVDTLKIYKKHFADNKNGLDYICRKHGLGKKTDQKYGDLWLRCIRGDKRAWRLLKKYNQEDVRINMKLYKFLLPWIDNHPNLATMLEQPGCPNCGSTDYSSDGYRFAQQVKYQRRICRSCGNRYKGTIPKKATTPVRTSGR